MTSEHGRRRRRIAQRLLGLAVVALALAGPGAALAGKKSKGLPVTLSTIGGPGAYALEPGESDSVFIGLSGCITVSTEKGGELLLLGSRVPPEHTRALCCTSCGSGGPQSFQLECDAAGPACRGLWRVDRP